MLIQWTLKAKTCIKYRLSNLKAHPFCAKQGLYVRELFWGTNTVTPQLFYHSSAFHYYSQMKPGNATGAETLAPEQQEWQCHSFEILVFLPQYSDEGNGTYFPF